MLAAGTEESAAACLHDSLDRIVAPGAGFSGPAIDSNAKFLAGNLGARHGVFSVRAGSGFSQHFPNCGMKWLDLARLNALSGSGGVDAGVPKCFAGVNIADTSDAGLVEKSGLDGALHFSQDGLEESCGKRGFEGLRAKFGIDLLDVFSCDNVDLTQSAGVVEDENAVIGEAAPEACCVWAEAIVGEYVEVAGHPKMDMEMLIFREMDKDVLGAAANVEDCCAMQDLEFLRLVRANGAGAFDCDGMDRSICSGLEQAADDCVYFREFRHRFCTSIRCVPRPLAGFVLQLRLEARDNQRNLAVGGAYRHFRRISPLARVLELQSGFGEQQAELSGGDATEEQTEQLD